MIKEKSVQKRIITISRQFGSGGRTIAQQLAKRLNFACYDREIITLVAQETGLSEPYISEACENAATTNPLLYALERINFSRRGVNISIKDELFKSMRRVIEQLAEEGNCIIVGRCADYILKDRADALHLFIHADVAHRTEKIVSFYGETLHDPTKELHARDTKRRLFYSTYTGREWGAPSNYSLSLNSGVIGEERCVTLVEEIIKRDK